MQRLFAPWRYTYVSGASAAPGCVLCRAVEDVGADALVVCRSERVFALLNRYPYTSGHVMVAPVEHTADLAALDAETLADMARLVQRVVAALERSYRPHGFNVGMNLGEAAGAGIVDHLHWHVVPRWRGDTNFMTVTGDVRVLPEELAQSWARLRRELGEGND